MSGFIHILFTSSKSGCNKRVLEIGTKKVVIQKAAFLVLCKAIIIVASVSHKRWQINVLIVASWSWLNLELQISLTLSTKQFLNLVGTRNPQTDKKMLFYLFSSFY